MAIVDLTRTLVGENQVVIGITDPTAQTSANAETLVAGTEIDARPWNTIQLVFMCATNDVTFKVYGGPTISAAVVELINTHAVTAGVGSIQSLTMNRSGLGAADTASPHANVPLNHRYYHVTIDSTGDGSHGASTVWITGYR